jgi:hypothetical protein
VIFWNFPIKSSNLCHVCGLEEHFVVSNHPVPLRHGGFKNPKTPTTNNFAQQAFYNPFGIIASTFYVGLAFVIFRTRAHKVIYARQGTSMNMEYCTSRMYSIHRQRQASAGNSDPCYSWTTNERRCRRSRSELT